MIRVTDINDLQGLIGFRDSLIPEYAILDADNKASGSGLFVNDISGLITVKNIKESIENPNLSDADFNQYLKDRMDSSMVNLIKAIYSEDDLIENRPLFANENDWTKELDNATDFVGYEINVSNSKIFTTVLNRIMLSFSGVNDVKILLFHSSKLAPIQTETITTESSSEVINAINWNLPFKNGKYYLGYLRSGLTAKALDRDYESASVMSGYNCLGLSQIQVVGWDSETLFDINDIDYTSETWGINIDISAYKDYTDLIVDNKDRYARAYQLQVAADILSLIASSTNSNRDERIIMTKALYDLNGNRSNPEIPYSVGILNQLKNEIKELKGLINPPVMQIDTLS